jgi:hypothetical protein
MVTRETILELIRGTKVLQALAIMKFRQFTLILRHLTIKDVFLVCTSVNDVIWYTVATPCDAVNMSEGNGRASGVVFV